MAGKGLIKAVAYLRTSSKTNVGTDKDSDKRQRRAVTDFAKVAGFEIVAEHYDPGVSGADTLEHRPGFSALLDQIEGNGVRTVIVEDVTRLARDLMVQELGILALIKRGVTVLASNGDNLTSTDDPMKKAMRQIAGAFAELEKARLVDKLKAARKRKAEAGGRAVGSKSYSEKYPEAVALAKRLKRYQKRSLAEITQDLAEAGHLTSEGKPFHRSAVHKMLSA
jgi:DNA invertase Pin-like site-specific DNA recombinase